MLYAAFAHLALSHWLFRPDELKAYRARRLVESTPTGAKQTTAKGAAIAKAKRPRAERDQSMTIRSAGDV